jgi:hypothetical protein
LYPSYQNYHKWHLLLRSMLHSTFRWWGHSSVLPFHAVVTSLWRAPWLWSCDPQMLGWECLGVGSFLVSEVLICNPLKRFIWLCCC